MPHSNDVPPSSSLLPIFAQKSTQKIRRDHPLHPPHSHTNILKLQPHINNKHTTTMEFDEDELATEVAVQEANVWRRRRIHLPFNFEERLAEDEEDFLSLIESGFVGTIRLPWGIRLRISVRLEAVRRAVRALRRRREERERQMPMRWSEIARGGGAGRRRFERRQMEYRAATRRRLGPTRRGMGTIGAASTPGFEPDWEVADGPAYAIATAMEEGDRDETGEYAEGEEW